MSIGQDELAMNAVLLGIGIAERVHGLPIGSTGQDKVADALLVIASGEETNVATGAEIREALPETSEQNRARTQKIQQGIALAILKMLQQRPF